LNAGPPIPPEPATLTYTGDTIASTSGPIHLAASVTQESDDAPGDIATAQTSFAIKDSNGVVVLQSTTAVAADGTSSTSIAAPPAGVYRIESSFSGNFSSGVASVPLVVLGRAGASPGGGSGPVQPAPAHAPD